MLKMIRAGLFLNSESQEGKTQAVNFGVNIKVLVALDVLPECKKPKPRLKTVECSFKGEESWQSGVLMLRRGKIVQ